jgi:hypothetical protein
MVHSSLTACDFDKYLDAATGNWHMMVYLHIKQSIVPATWNKDDPIC